MSFPEITGFHLSPHQRHLWQQSETDTRLLPAQCSFTIQGELQPPQLKAALQTLVEQHEILRTAFQQTPGLPLPLQVIQPPAPIAWQVIDLSMAAAADQTAKMRAWQVSEWHQLHALAMSQHLRALLFRLGQQSYRLLLTLPALCADTQTYQILLMQLSQCYVGDLSWLEEEPLQYAQFAAWHNQLLTDKDEAALAGQAFWQQQDLANHKALRPPLRYRYSQPPAFTPQVYRVDVAPAVAIALQQSEFSIQAILLTSWLSLLWRHADAAEVTIGVACEGRQDEELVQACGPFTRFLPLRCDLSGEMPFSALLRRVEQVYHDLTVWQDYVPTDLSDDPIRLPVGFEFVKLIPGVTVNGIQFALDQAWVYPDCFDLKLTTLQREGRLILEFHYNETVLSGAAIAALADQLDTLLRHVSRQPTTAIGHLSLVSDQLRQKYLTQLREPPPLPAPPSPARCLHQRFEHQVEQSPSHVALIVEDQQLTYRELNQRANQLARYLKQLGAGPEVRAALYLERSPDLMIALLAILKAGSVYLPLDPMLPANRINFQLRDAQTAILITRQSLLGDEIEVPAQIVCLTSDRARVEAQSDANLETTVIPTNLAYVIYTSGSTGEPKGVAVEHRQLLSYVDSVLERLDLPTGAHYATVSTIAADLGQTMIFPCWCRGGTLHLITTERVSDAQAWASYGEPHPLDCLKIVPSHLQALLQTPHSQSLLPRQRLVLGGEVCPWTLIEQVQQLVPSCRIFNHYGPTETTVGALTHGVTTDALAQRPAATVPLGQALANSRVYLLDRHLAPVPVGIPGEIYVSGAGVTRGYLQRPGLTAARFIPDPFSTQPGTRMYGTGDLARTLPDGTLEFIRRVDSQVKLHGFRIELGAIEAQLMQHPDVQMATVILREDTPGNPLLVAYMVLQSEAVEETATWRAFLQQWLPAPMIPSLFVTLPALPLTPNGKVDRQALPVPAKLSPDLSAQYVAPRNPTEEAIAAIWMEVLDLETVGVHSHFFDLGGHSLLATQVLSRLRETFQIELPLHQLFEARTVAEIAVVVVAALLEEIETMTDEEAEAMIQRTH